MVSQKSQNIIYALGKEHMRSIVYLRCFSSVAFETIPMLVWPTMALSCPWLTDDDPFSSCHGTSSSVSLSLRLSLPGDRWCDVFGFMPTSRVSSFSTLMIFRDARYLWWSLCPPVSRSAQSVSLTPACSGQYVHCSLRRWVLNVVMCIYTYVLLKKNS